MYNNVLSKDVIRGSVSVPSPYSFMYLRIKVCYVSKFGQLDIQYTHEGT